MGTSKCRAVHAVVDLRYQGSRNARLLQYVARAGRNGDQGVEISQDEAIQCVVSAHPQTSAGPSVTGGDDRELGPPRRPVAVHVRLIPVRMNDVHSMANRDVGNPDANLRVKPPLAEYL